MSTIYILKSDQTGGYSRFSKSSFANLFLKIEWTCAPLNCLPRTAKVSFLVQPLSNGIKGYPFFAVLRDGLKDEYLVIRMVIAGEGRGTTFEGKIIDYISDVFPSLICTNDTVE